MTRSSSYQNHLDQARALLKESSAHLAGILVHCNAASGHARGSIEAGRLGYVGFSADELLRAVSQLRDILDELAAKHQGAPAGGLD